MLWLVLACAAFATTVAANVRKWGPVAFYARLGMYASLAVWIVTRAGGKAFQGSETSLLGWFVWGLLFLLAGEILSKWGGALSGYALIPIPLMAVCFALGFDVFRPDAYATVPAAILGVFTVAVSGRAYLKLAGRGGKKASLKEQIGLFFKVAAEAFMVYAAIYKVIDRGWDLPWSYMAAGGGLLFSAAQMWIGWKKVLGKQTVAEWLPPVAGDLGVLSMVVAAFFVYQPFL